MQKKSKGKKGAKYKRERGNKKFVILSVSFSLYYNKKSKF